MHRPITWHRPLTLSLALITLAAPATGAGVATDVTISDAKIAGGKLTISGTAAPNSWVRLDGQSRAEFSVRSEADGTFEFGLLYHPGDCIVDVQRLLSPVKLGPATQALASGMWRTFNFDGSSASDDLDAVVGSCRLLAHGTPSACPIIWESQGRCRQRTGPQLSQHRNDGTDWSQ